MEIDNKQKALNRAEQSEKKVSELTAKLISEQNDLKIKTEEYEKSKKKVEDQKAQLKQEEKKKIETDELKRKIIGENFCLKRANERIEYEVARLKQKFGEEVFEEEKKVIEMKEKEKEDEIQRLKEENKKEQFEKENGIQRANIAEERIKILEQEKEKEKNGEDEKIKKIETEKNQKNMKNNKLKQDIPIPISISNQNSPQILFTDVDGSMKRISKKQKRNNVIPLTQVLENGTYSLEVEFQKTDNVMLGIGIMQESYNFPSGADVFPFFNPHQSHIAIYCGKYENENTLWCKGSKTAGNVYVANNKIIRAEYDSEKGTLIFFNDNIQQPVYVSGIKEKVLFIIYMYNNEASCLIRSFKKLGLSTTKNIANEKAIQW
ncbi:MAG: hypothetical protein EZS28_028082 [Streblomastix strix]|uniref:B30.2/SPRY domain-containing protein n=1 Tax=Streblomastix strix TaxID=222440 RepID=A0A5J4V1Z5_9EUKA|nr:MAG: hypothetical protein EZS28_028082 [Streblomastix strix]